MTMNEGHIWLALRSINRWKSCSAAWAKQILPCCLIGLPDESHCYAWQQRTIARLEAALHDRETQFPMLPG
jgi:hypothetical protein